MRVHRRFGGRLTMGVVAAVLLIGGCASGHHIAASPVAMWTARDAVPISQPEFVDGVLVVMTTTDKKVWVEGLDAATGARLWRQESRASDVTPGVALSFEHDEKNVYMLSPGLLGDEPSATGTAVAARTGKIVWTTYDDWTFLDAPIFCQDDKTALCILEAVSDNTASNLVRIAVKDGSEQLTAARAGRSVGAGIYEAFDADGQDLLTQDPALSPAPTSWADKVSDLFGPGYSPDHGYDVLRIDSRKLFVGSVGAVDPTSPSEISAWQTTDGKRVWLDKGGDIGCGLVLPFATIDLTLIRCRTATAPAGTKPTQPSDTVVEGYDPATGRTTWSWDAGPLPSGWQAPQVGEQSYMITNTRGQRSILDLATGKAHAATGSEIGWCVRYGTEYPAFTDRGASGTRAPAQSIYSCMADGKPTQILPSAPSYFMNDRHGDEIAWSDGTTIRTARRAS